MTQISCPPWNIIPHSPKMVYFIKKCNRKFSKTLILQRLNFLFVAISVLNRAEPSPRLGSEATSKDAWLHNILVAVHELSLLERSQMPSEKSTSSFLSFYFKHSACECIANVKTAHAMTQRHEGTIAGNWLHINLFLHWPFVSGSVNCRFLS